MTRHLILMRHAKSSWHHPGLADHDRPLNARGRRAAGEVALWLAGLGAGPDQVLTSSATRTRETWARMAPALPGPVAVQVVPKLYAATPETMLAVLRGAAGARVLMLGHNPGTAALAGLLAAEPPADPDFARYPTAAATLFDFGPGKWADVRPGTGHITGFAIPRALPT